MIGEYFTALVAVSVCSAVGVYMAYNPSDRTTRSAVALIVLYLTTVYAVGIARAVEDIDIESVYEGAQEDFSLSDSEYARTAEEAFVLGIKRALAERFAFSESDISVSAVGFSIENMTARKISVVLSGAAAYADYRAVEQFVFSSGLGECRVEVNFG